MSMYVIEVLDDKLHPPGGKLAGQDTKNITSTNKESTNVKQTAAHEQAVNASSAA